MKIIAIPISIILSLGLIISCHSEVHDHDHEHAQVHSHDHDHNHEHEHEHDHAHNHDHDLDHHQHNHGENVVIFSSEQAKKIGLQLETLSPAPLGQIIKTTAQVLPSQGDERQAAATASGIIRYVNSSLVEGDVVKAGQSLFEIESSGMAEANISVKAKETEAQYRAAKSAYERKCKLAEDHIVSQADLEQARATYESAKAAYDNLKGNFSAKGAIVRAPISGYVRSIDVANGAYVEAGHSVVTVSQNRDLQLRAEVQPRYYPWLKNITGVNVRIPGIDTAVSLGSSGTNWVSYGKSTDAACPLIPVTFRIRNTHQLISGTFVTAYIVTRSSQPVISVPNESLVEEMGSFFVFVKIHGDEYDKRLVSIGATDGIRTEIRSGLSKGETVVTHGAAMVRLAQNSAALDPHAGHVH